MRKNIVKQLKLQLLYQQLNSKNIDTNKHRTNFELQNKKLNSRYIHLTRQ